MSEPHALQVISADKMLARANEVFDAIARRAFEIFDGNGQQFGHDLDDWLKAENELLHPVPVEIAESEGAITVRAEVPGFREQDLKVSAEPRRLTITGKRESWSERKQKGKTVYAERYSDQVFRVVDLPAEVETAASAIKATCEQGVVIVTLQKAGAAAARPNKADAKSAPA